MLEEKIINNFPDYTINKDGVVKNIKTGVTVKSYIFKGFYAIQLKNQKIRYTKLIHTLVANAFLQKDSEGHKRVFHLNGNKLDNRLENLTWLCGSYYKSIYKKCKEKEEPRIKKISAQLIQDAKTENKLTIEQAEDVRKLYKSKAKTIDQLATEYNVSKTKIDDIINNIILKPLKKGSVREYWVQRRKRFLEETAK